jgi:uncharacterized phosphosugar-binding protein
MPTTITGTSLATTDVTSTNVTSTDVSSTTIDITNGSGGSVSLTAPSGSGANTITIPASTGTMALTSNVIGVGQTWTDVTTLRASNQTYRNNTGKPIQVFIQILLASNGSASFAINGITFSVTANSGAGSTATTLSFIIPDQNEYIFIGTISKWAELR